MANQKMIEIIKPRIVGFLAQAEAMSGLAHSGLKGRFREALIREMIAPFLPPDAVIYRGTIVFPNVERSERNEDDLVIFSRSKSPLIFELDDAIMPFEGVLLHIEVKSKLQKDDVKKAVKAAKEINSNVPLDKRCPPAIIFALQSDLTINPHDPHSELNRLLDIIEEIKYHPTRGQTTSPIQMLCIADRGTWLLRSDSEEGWHFVSKDEERHLLTFISVFTSVPS